MKSFLRVLTSMLLVIGFVFSVAGCKVNGEENDEPNVPNAEEQLPKPEQGGGEEENVENEPTPEQKEENKDFGNWH